MLGATLSVLGFLAPPVSTDAQAFVTSGPALEFDLGEPGVQPLVPQTDPDVDAGPNDLQNYPVLTSATSDASGSTISGGINTFPNHSFRLEFFSSSISPDVLRGGEQFLGSMDVTTDASGNAPFSFQSPIPVPDGQYVLSTTTLLVQASDGTEVPAATSEFSDGVMVGAVAAQPTANLSVSQSAAPIPAPAGGNLTFTLTVANAGPDPATGVRLVVTPPPGSTFVSATGGVAPAGGTVTFNLGTLASGATATVNVIVQSGAPGTLVSTATVASDASDPATADNTATTSVTVVPIFIVEPPPPPAPDTVGPTVSRVAQGPDTKAKQTTVVLTFSEELDRTRAASLANYRLVTPGRDKRFGTRDDKVVALLSATYDSTARTVTLVLRKKLTVSGQYQLTVDGTSAGGVADLVGNLLDGDHDGRVSGNFVATLKLKPPKGRPRK